MPLRPEDLPREPEALVALALSQAAEIEALRTTLRILQAQIFPPKSERASAVLEGQLSLDLGDLTCELKRVAANDEAGARSGRRATRKPAQRNLGQLPSWLPRVERVIEPPISACPCCAGALHRIGEDVAEALDVVPAIVRVVRTIRPKYACRACEGGVTQAPARSRLLVGGVATTALMASVAVWKYAWHMPLNRQAQMLAGQGIRLDRSTLVRWIKRVAWWLRGLYERQLEVIHSHPRVFCDETRLPVRKKGCRRTHTGQFWAHAIDDQAWGGPAPPAVAYVFAQGRSHKEIREQLASYQGLLQVDGYGAYKALAKAGRKPGPITLAFCLVHARRKFTDVYKATSSAVAAEVISRLSQVYAIEARICGTSAAHRLEMRQTLSAPLMTDLKALLEAELAGLSSKSKLAGAIRYSLGHWMGLTRFLQDGRLEVDNNTVERNMRPIALGRKNHLFAGDDGGAQSWAILASLLNTAKLNGVDPYAWLSDVLEQMVSGQVKANDLDQLLVWNWKVARASANLAAAA